MFSNGIVDDIYDVVNVENLECLLRGFIISVNINVSMSMATSVIRKRGWNGITHFSLPKDAIELIEEGGFNDPQIEKELLEKGCCVLEEHGYTDHTTIPINNDHKFETKIFVTTEKFEHFIVNGPNEDKGKFMKWSLVQKEMNLHNKKNGKYFADSVEQWRNGRLSNGSFLNQCISIFFTHSSDIQAFAAFSNGNYTIMIDKEGVCVPDLLQKLHNGGVFKMFKDGFQLVFGGTNGQIIVNSALSDLFHSLSCIYS